MAGDRGALGRVLRRRGRPRRRPHHLRRRRREAVDLQLPGRRPGRVRRQGARTTGRVLADVGSELQHCDLLLFLPLRPADPRASSTRSSPAPPATGLAGAHRAPRLRPRQARPRRALAVPAEARAARRAPLGRIRSTPAPRTTRSASSPAASPATVAGWLATAPRAARRGPRDPPRRRDDPGAAAQRALRRDHPRAEARRACRSPAPTSCASAASSPSTTCSPRCASPPRRRDDLSLAALLRSPLGGLTERELFELAHPADRRPLAGAARRSRPAAGPRCARSSPTCATGPTTCARSSSSPASSSATTAAASSSPGSAPRPRTASTR